MKPWGMALAACCAWAQSVAPGKILLATDMSADPDFARSVILIVHSDEKGSVGLMLHRRMDAHVSEVFPEVKEPFPVYAGGPVTIGYMALARAFSTPPAGHRLFGDVYWISGKQQVAAALAAHRPPRAFRVYLGYCGWSTPQLKSEAGRGLWRVLAADASIVFDSDPPTLWRRLTAAYKSRSR
jgi:putative transcriptional regulator